MGSLLLSLIPTALGIFLSPLAVVAVIAVLVSARARLNSLAFLTGRLVGITVAVVGGYLLLLAFNVQQRRDPSSWLILLHLLLAVVLLIGAGYVLLRGRQRVREMAAAKTPAEVAEAAPQLPGWLQSIDRFTPTRTLAMGLGLFLFNPIDLSCAIAGALTIALSGAPEDDTNSRHHSLHRRGDLVYRRPGRDPPDPRGCRHTTAQPPQVLDRRSLARTQGPAAGRDRDHASLQGLAIAVKHPSIQHRLAHQVVRARGWSTRNAFSKRTHIDHDGGIKGVADVADVASGRVPIIAQGTIGSFDKFAVGENVVAGKRDVPARGHAFRSLLEVNPRGMATCGIGYSTDDVLVPVKTFSRPRRPAPVDAQTGPATAVGVTPLASQD